MTSSGDISLIAQVLLFNNKRAFDQLVRKYQSPVRNFLMRLTAGDRELSDDLAQETFLKAYVHLDSFRNLSEFSTWLIRIAYHTYYDYIRSRKEWMPMDEEVIELSHHAVQHDSAQMMDVYAGLRYLKEEERSCIILFYMQDLSIRKISSVMNLPEGTVKSHLSRGKEKLAHFLKQNGYGT
ncbi:MAG: sigma-70 family RNA polymerase sigma factor [Bacteroidales bacterium]|jgi:RNA polymerase sigma-70 factor, ECF subfamily|nr:sigma-70 family RNA polymerase sigma factor [Bacteroidales bacterium]